MNDLLATYRLQMRRELGFAEVTRWLSYFRDLGISHLYLSPILQAAPGSTHGYDVVDPTRVNDELGGDEAFARFSGALKDAGLGQLIDIVPNHMAVGPQNPWWWDVLENGPASLYASFFDLEWSLHEERMRDRVLLPVLGNHAGLVVDAGEIKLERQGGTFVLAYFDHRFPVAPRSLTEVVRRAAEDAASPDLAFIADAYENLPLPNATDRASVERRHRDKSVLGGQLARLAAENPPIAAALDRALAALNEDKEALDAFLQQQNHRLAFWRTAARDLGYRRFFDVNTLAAIRMEEEAVFRATHLRIREWVERGFIDGVRVDHVDGLRDPLTYLARLRSLVPDGYVFVEKILVGDELLRAYWPVDGTTGYELIGQTGSLFVDPRAEETLSKLYAESSGETRSLEEVQHACKRMVVGELFGSDLNRLTAAFLALCEKRRHFRDYSRHEIHEALRELLASFPVYRTYVRAGEPPLAEDVRLIDAALEAVKAREPDLEPRLIDFLGSVLKGETDGDDEADFAARFQQTTGPVTAKGVEDTTFYAFNGFVALNEVGGAPDRFGMSLEAFHAAAEARRARWPACLLASSTHDTKRSEDVRARLFLLTECPESWAEFVARAREVGDQHRRDAAPDDNTIYLYLQTLVGAWPLSADRAAAYMLKAAREAKARTSWTRPDEGFEKALEAYVRATLADPAFTQAVEDVVAPLLKPGRENALAQLVLKLTSPGVPDIYQGTELWDLSLVDPDNRRLVDFEKRVTCLRQLEGLHVDALAARLGEPEDPGLPKMFVLRETLRARARHAASFGPEGSYQPLYANGQGRDAVIAFLRGGDVATLVTRWPLRRSYARARGEQDDATFALPAGQWRNLFTGETRRGGVEAPVREWLAAFPVAVFEKV